MNRSIKDVFKGPKYEYYNFQFTNTTTDDVEAKKQDSLSLELLRHPDDWLANIQRFEIDTRGMPLTMNNIPFQTWQISIGYNSTFANKIYSAKKVKKQKAKIPRSNDSSNVAGWQYFSAIVPQYDPKEEQVYTYILSSTSLSAFLNTNMVKSVDISGILQMASDNKYMYVLTNTHVYIYDYALVLVFAVTGTGVSISTSANNGFLIATADNITNYVYSSTNLTWTAGNIFTTAQPYDLVAVACDMLTVFAVDQYGFYYKWALETPGNPIATGNTDNYRWSQLSYNNSQLIASGNTPLQIANVFATSNVGPVDLLIPEELEFIPGTATTAAVLIGSWASGVIYSGNSGTLQQSTLSSGIATGWTASTPLEPITATALCSAYRANSNATALFIYSQSTQLIYSYDIYTPWGGAAGVVCHLASFRNNTVSIDCLEDNTMIIVDNLGNVEKTDQPVLQRNFLLAPTSNQGLYGVNYYSDQTSHQQQVSSLFINADYFRLTTDGTDYIWWNAVGNLITVTSQNGSTVRTFAADAQIDQISSCINQTTVSVGLDIDGNVEIFNHSTGTVEGTISPSIGQTISFVGLYSENVVLVAFAVPSQIVVYNISNPASPTVTATFTTADGIPDSILYLTVMPPNDVAPNGAFGVTTPDGGATPNSFFIFSFANSGLTSITSSNIYLASSPGMYAACNQRTFEFYLYNFTNGLTVAYSGVTLEAVQYTLPVSTLFLPQPNPIYTYSSITSETITERSLDLISPVLPLSITADRTSSNLFGCDAANVYVGTLTGTIITWESTGAIGNYVKLAAIVQQNASEITKTIARLSTVDLSVLTSSTPPSLPSFIYAQGSSSSVITSFGLNEIDQYTVANGTYTTTTYGVGTILGYSNSVGTPVPSVPYPIYQYQDFLNKINETIARVVQQLVDADIGFTDTTPPLIYFDVSSKLFKITATDTYLSNTVALDFNLPLYQRFLFQSTVDINNTIETIDGNSWQQILFVNYNTNVGLFQTFNVNSSVVSYVTMTSGNVLALWNDTTTIIVRSDKIPILGDQSGSNQIINQITDITPDFGSILPGETIIYAPTYLRQYNMKSSGQSFNTTDISFAYMTKDGTIYNLMLVPGGYFSVKIQFTFAA